MIAWVLGVLLLGGLSYVSFLLVQERRLAIAQRQADAIDVSTSETKAQQAEQKLEALSESSGAGFLMLDRKARITKANGTAEHLLGLDEALMLGRSLIQATLLPDLQTFAESAIAKQRERTDDFRLPGVNGRYLRATVYPAGAEAMLVLVDVTEIRKLETIRRDFVANVSHELRTPLTSIKAMAETLQGGALHDPEVAASFLATIMKEADRLARIAEDLLILSDAESKVPTKSSFDLSELVREVVARFSSEAAESGQSLDACLPGPAEVLASRDQMEQVVVNLISNAIKYTPREGKITVEVEREDSGVLLSVQDTGIGIMQEDLPRIFERFYRVDKARSRQSGGTGLGLSIVKNIVEAHGGEVTVTSEFNRGSCFTVNLPSGKA